MIYRQIWSCNLLQVVESLLSDSQGGALLWKLLLQTDQINVLSDIYPDRQINKVCYFQRRVAGVAVAEVTTPKVLFKRYFCKLVCKLVAMLHMN